MMHGRSPFLRRDIPYSGQIPHVFPKAAEHGGPRSALALDKVRLIGD